MVSSTDGSPTSTCWNRRSSAGSFSIRCRYSSSVVAPTIRSSPRASIGLSMLPASIAPSAAPAPTTVCSSSMNVMIWPSLLLDLVQHGLEPLLELAAVLGARDHRAEVERDDPLAAQRLGHVAGHDALGQALDDGGLADAGLADQHRVVLGPAGQHLDDPADLGVAADDRVELALAGAAGSGRCRTSPAPGRCPPGPARSPGRGRGPARTRRRAAEARRPRRAAGWRPGRRRWPGRPAGARSRCTRRCISRASLPAVASAASSGREVSGALTVAPAACGSLASWSRGRLQHGGRVRADGAQQRCRGAALLLEQGGQQVQAVDVRVAGRGSRLHRLGESLLALPGQLLIHGCRLLQMVHTVGNGRMLVARAGCWPPRRLSLNRQPCRLRAGRRRLAAATA